MSLVRPILLLFAIMLCMAGALAPKQAFAHAGPHSIPSADMRRDIQKQDAVVSARNDGVTGEADRHCAAQMCCGSACFSGGYVIAGEMNLPEPMEGSALIMPSPSRTTKGLGPTGSAALRAPDLPHLNSFGHSSLSHMMCVRLKEHAS